MISYGGPFGGGGPIFGGGGLPGGLGTVGLNFEPAATMNTEFRAAGAFPNTQLVYIRIDQIGQATYLHNKSFPVDKW